MKKFVLSSFLLASACTFAVAAPFNVKRDKKNTQKQPSNAQKISVSKMSSGKTQFVRIPLSTGVKK